MIGYATLSGAFLLMWAAENPFHVTGAIILVVALLGIIRSVRDIYVPLDETAS